ncbi:MAG: hypothetical protein ACKV2U_33415 [Bryobacteraceae bacterium]
MKPLWTLEKLETALEGGRKFGREVLVADSLDVLGKSGEVATIYFRFEGTGTSSDQAKYHFTFDNTQSLDKNFELLWECVESFRKMERQRESTAATR